MLERWFLTTAFFAPGFQCCYFCECLCLICPRFNFDCYVSKRMHLRARNLSRKPNNFVSEEAKQN